MLKLIGYIFLLAPLIGFGQLTGVVVDAQNNEPLPYVHIGVIGKNLGTISRIDGTFTTPVLTKNQEDSLTFSMLGYQRIAFDIATLKSPLKIELKRQTVLLKEVRVTASRDKIEVVKLGRTKPGKVTLGQSGHKTYGWGGEWAVEITTDTPMLLLNANFHLRFNTIDSVLFRINIYDLTNGMPGTSQLQKPIFTTSYSGDHWIQADLSTQTIQVDGPFVVSIELVQIWFSEKGSNQLFYTYAKNPEGRIFSRSSSLDQWTQGGQMPDLTLYVSAIEAKSKE